MASYISLLDLTYPVGAYYLSNSSTSPASFFGGAWSALTNRFLYCNSGTYTGGSNTHTLTSNEIPSHSHAEWIWTSGSEASGYGLLPSEGFGNRVMVKAPSSSGIYTSSTGGGVLTTTCQHIRRAIVGEEPLNLCGGEA